MYGDGRAKLAGTLFYCARDTEEVALPAITIDPGRLVTFLSCFFSHFFRVFFSLLTLEDLELLSLAQSQSTTATLWRS